MTLRTFSIDEPAVARVLFELVENVLSVFFDGALKVRANTGEEDEVAEGDDTTEEWRLSVLGRLRRVTSSASLPEACALAAWASAAPPVTATAALARVLEKTSS